MKKFSLLLLAAVLLFAILITSGCGAAGKNASPESANGRYDSSTGAADADFSAEMSAEKSSLKSSLSDTSAGKADGENAESSVSAADGRKVIYSSEFTIETKDFSASCTALEALIDRYGGYIESSDIYTGDNDRYRKRYATYTIRVPVENYKKLTSEAGTVGTVISKCDNNRDVTESYFDIESRLSTLETKRDRLLALLDKATDMYEIVTLNDALETTLYDIERLTGQLKKYDSLINYSTVTVYVHEVAEITEVKTGDETLGERIAAAFKDSVKGVGAFFEWLIVVLSALLPVAVVVIPVIIVIIIIVRAVRKKKSKKRESSEK